MEDGKSVPVGSPVGQKESSAPIGSPTARRYIPEVRNVHENCRQNLKSLREKAPGKGHLDRTHLSFNKTARYFMSEMKSTVSR
jgi:hypothetical protein